FWTSEGQIVYASLNSGLFRVRASGGTPVALTTLDNSRRENSHRWPQLLPGGRFLFWIRGKPEDAGIYAASFANPAERKRILVTDTNAIYAPGGDGKHYLLWLRGATLVA